MRGFPFWKMSGAGNDFVLMDYREVPWEQWDLSEMAKKICRRRISVGADGLILLLPSKRAQNDFSWRFFNPDGSEAEMCGNGARCAARFARFKGLASARMRFETLAGVIEAEVRGEEVKILLGDAFEMPEEKVLQAAGQELRLVFVNTGVPHAVCFVNDVKDVAVVPLGREIRHHQVFSPAGTNVDFIQITGPRALKMRTYERGVEDETLACGTGAGASALAAHFLGQASSPVSVVTRSQRTLTIHFQSRENRYGPVYLEGDAQCVYEGRLLPHAYE
jgi:diaminopimelate epimerase